MPLFTRKPSKETSLQRIYTEAYQSSLQSILKESSFEFKDSLEAWKQTLAQITSGMALLDGSPPKTGQEKSLLASIMDIERQCHDRIAALKTRLDSMAKASRGEAAVRHSPYGTSLSNLSASSVADLSLNDKRKVQRVAVGAKSPRADPVKSEPVLNNQAPTATVGEQRVSQPLQNSPQFDFTDKFTSHIPKVSEMPYKLYSKKPAVNPVQQAPLTRSAPALATESLKSKKEQPIQHRSSLDYPQPAPAHHSHSLLTTLRGKNPLKSRNRNGGSSGSQHQAQPQPPAHGAQPSPPPQHQCTPSPRSSGENIALTAAKQTAMAAAASKPESPNLQQFSGFEGTFSTDSQPSSPTFSSPSESSPTSFAADRHQVAAVAAVLPFQQQQQQAQHQQQQGHRLAQPSISPSQTLTNQASNSARSSPQAAPATLAQSVKKTQFQVAYEKVPTASGRTIYRPRVVRTTVGGPPSSGSQATAPSSNAQPSSRNRSPQARVLADGKPENGGDTVNLDEMDDWDRMVHQKIAELRGVDKAAAEQIVNEVVLKGDKVNWDDIAGLEKAKASLKETVVYPFLRPDLFMGLREPVLGMLLFGPPGTGKTMLARAVATESKSTFFSISASSLTSKYMGESEKLVRALFQLAKALAPSIIFVDEIDSILTQRADSGEHEASRRIKNEFLVQWSDLQAAAAGKNSTDGDVKRVLVLGATNLPWAIDEAARRRFVRRQYIPLPEPFTRKVHLEKLLSHQKHALTPAELEQLMELTDGYSGSDLTALAKDAAMGPLRSLGDALLTTAPDQIRPMGMSDFIESMRSIRPSVSPEGLRAFEQWADMYGSSGA